MFPTPKLIQQTVSQIPQEDIIYLKSLSDVELAHTLILILEEETISPTSWLKLILLHLKRISITNQDPLNLISEIRTSLNNLEIYTKESEDIEIIDFETLFPNLQMLSQTNYTSSTPECNYLRKALLADKEDLQELIQEFPTSTILSLEHIAQKLFRQIYKMSNKNLPFLNSILEILELNFLEENLNTFLEIIEKEKDNEDNESNYNLHQHLDSYATLSKFIKFINALDIRIEDKGEKYVVYYENTALVLKKIRKQIHIGSFFAPSLTNLYTEEEIYQALLSSKLI